MKALFLRLDERLLGLYQRLIDASQRSRNWWAEQCTLGFGAMVVLVLVFTQEPGTFDYVCAMVGVFYSAIFVWVARSAPVFDSFAAYSIKSRKFGLCVLFIAVAMDVLRWSLGLPPAARALAGDAAILLLVSTDYFACCNPPAPPRRREKLALGTSL